MANSVTARFNDDCKVFVSMSDDTTVEKAVIIDAEGNETDIGGGGESDFTKAKVSLLCPDGADSASYVIIMNNASEGVVDFDYFSAYYIDNTHGVINAISDPVVVTDVESPVDIDFNIIKNKNILVTGLSPEAAFGVSGDAVVQTVNIIGDSYNAVIITGDCSITYTE